MIRDITSSIATSSRMFCSSANHANWQSDSRAYYNL